MKLLYQKINRNENTKNHAEINKSNSYTPILCISIILITLPLIIGLLGNILIMIYNTIS